VAKEVAKTEKKERTKTSLKNHHKGRCINWLLKQKNQSIQKWIAKPIWRIKGNRRGFAPTIRRIMYSIGNYGECLKKSSQGLKTFSRKGKEIMEGISDGAK